MILCYLPQIFLLLLLFLVLSLFFFFLSFFERTTVNNVQELVCICYLGESRHVGVWKYWILLVKDRFFSGCTTKKKGRPANPRKLPDFSNRDLHNCILMSVHCADRLLIERPEWWPYGVTVRDGHWHLPRGDTENLTLDGLVVHVLRAARNVWTGP